MRLTTHSGLEVTAGPIARKLARKEGNMSLIRIAVEAQLSKSRLTIRDLLNSAYFRRYGKPMPEKSLAEDVAKWEQGANNIPYLYDFIFESQCS